MGCAGAVARGGQDGADQRRRPGRADQFAPSRCDLRGVRSPFIAGGRYGSKMDFVDGVVGVAELVPSRLVRLCPPGQVGGPGPDRDVAMAGESGWPLPPLPAVPAGFTDERGRPPGSIVDAHRDLGDGRGSRPGHPADRDVAWRGRCAGRCAPKTVDELLAQARATLPGRPSPAEALRAQADGALLIDIRGDDQRREDGLIPGAIVLPRTAWNGVATPRASGGTPPSPAGTCASSSSVSRDTSPAWPQRTCSSWASATQPTSTEDSPPGPRPACH